MNAKKKNRNFKLDVAHTRLIFAANPPPPFYSFKPRFYVPSEFGRPVCRGSPSPRISYYGRIPAACHRKPDDLNLNKSAMMRASTFDRIDCGKIIHRSFHGSLYIYMYIYIYICMRFRIQKTENRVAFEPIRRRFSSYRFKLRSRGFYPNLFIL